MFSARFAALALAVLAGGGVILLHAAHAAGAGASVGASVVSTALVAADAAAQVLLETSTGVLTLSIPGAAAVAMQVSAVEVVPQSGTMVFSVAEGAAGLAELVAQLGEAGGSLSSSGTLNGQGIQIVVLGAEQHGDGGGTVTAIVTYN